MEWRCLPFSQVPAATLYRVLALRSRVFVVEQECVYQDVDGLDPEALIVIGSLQARRHPGTRLDCGDEDDPADAGACVAADAEVVATARVLPPGLRFPEPSIGRVCTSPCHRREGLGRMLMAYAIRRARDHYPGWSVRISAQAYLQAFYQSLGFEPSSAPYLEDRIPHLEMRLAPESRPGSADAMQGAGARA